MLEIHRNFKLTRCKCKEAKITDSVSTSVVLRKQKLGR
jgi:hypothetical protein